MGGERTSEHMRELTYPRVRLRLAAATVRQVAMASNRPFRRCPDQVSHGVGGRASNAVICAQPAIAWAAGSAMPLGSTLPEFCGKSNRSAFITFVQALMKSRTNISSLPRSA